MEKGISSVFNSWHLGNQRLGTEGAGTWHRHLATGSWRLAAWQSGTSGQLAWFDPSSGEFVKLNISVSLKCENFLVYSCIHATRKVCTLGWSSSSERSHDVRKKHTLNLKTSSLGLRLATELYGDISIIKSPLGEPKRGRISSYLADQLD